MRSIARQIAHTLFTKGLTAVSRIALTVVLSRNLAAADYGAYALIGTVDTFGVLLVGLSLFMYVYRAAPGRNEESQLRLFKTTFLFELSATIVLVVATIASGSLPVFLRWFHADGYERVFAIGLALLVLLVALAEATYFLQAQTRIETANWIDFLSQAAWILPFALWWVAGRPVTVETVLLAQIGGCIAALALAARQIGLGGWLRARFLWSELRPAIAFSVPTIVPSIAFYALKLADRFILSSYWTLKEVGLYSFAYTFVNMVYTFSAWAIFNAFGPRIIAAHNNGDLEQRDLLQTYMLKVSITSYACGVVAILILYRPVIAAIARPEYVEAVRALPLLALVQLVVIAAYPAGNMLFMENRVRLSAAIDFIGMIVGVGCNLLLIPRWSYMGAAVASLFGFVTIFVGKYAASGMIARLRFDRLFSIDNEVRLLNSYYRRFRHAN